MGIRIIDNMRKGLLLWNSAVYNEELLNYKDKVYYKHCQKHK